MKKILSKKNLIKNFPSSSPPSIPSKKPPKPPSALKDLSIAVIKHTQVDSQKLDYLLNL